MTEEIDVGTLSAFICPVCFTAFRVSAESPYGRIVWNGKDTISFYAEDGVTLVKKVPIGAGKHIYVA